MHISMATLDASSSRKAALSPVTFAVFLILVDFFFIMAQGLGVPKHAVPLLGFYAPDPMMALDREGGWPEVFGYVKELFIVGGFAVLFRRRRSPILLGFSITYVLIFLDDAFQLHERGGAALVDALDLQSVGLVNAEQIGELLVWCGLGGIVTLALGLGTWLSTAAERRRALPFAACLVSLMVFAIGLDVVHSAIGDLLGGGKIVGFFGILEDGGELVVLSITCGVVLHHLMAADLTAADAQAGLAETGSGPP